MLQDRYDIAAERLARRFHETYERLARAASAKPWEDVPEQDRALMIETCRELLRDSDFLAVAVPILSRD